jgi:branched-chain amino acid transport system ATP-binding protein
MTTSDHALRVEGVWVRYGVIPALQGVDLSVRPGEVVALVGPNGAGKTTLLRAISRLERVCEGRIEAAGTRLDGLPPWDVAARGVAHVPQGRRCFPALTVEENLEVGGYRLPLAQARVMRDAVFAAFPALVAKRRQLASELSGGQQQMLVIGRALMSSPKLLLLDEPSLGLAPVVVQELETTLADLTRTFGVAILLAEQRTSLALKVARRAHVIRAGKIVLAGESAAIAPDVRQAYLGSVATAGRPIATIEQKGQRA